MQYKIVYADTADIHSARHIGAIVLASKLAATITALQAIGCVIQSVSIK